MMRYIKFMIDIETEMPLPKVVFITVLVHVL